MKKAFLSLIIVMTMLFSATLALASESNPFEGMKIYDEGGYKVGRDFDAGEYVLLCTSSLPAYFSISTDANGRDIVANDNFATNSIITVYDGDYLELSRCMAILADDFYKEYSIKTENDGTMLKVGYDILPGEYKLVVTGSLPGYYCIYNSSRQTDIVANDNFKNGTWVTVQFGQYLVLSRCHIQQ
ncbi:MAG: hypothetical protein IJK06_01115 [Clostridia bacterium]|nr:hypothetical protein [Clostridia bacterium]